MYFSYYGQCVCWVRYALYGMCCVCVVSVRFSGGARTHTNHVYIMCMIIVLGGEWMGYLCVCFFLLWVNTTLNGDHCGNCSTLLTWRADILCRLYLCIVWPGIVHGTRIHHHQHDRAHTHTQHARDAHSSIITWAPSMRERARHTDAHCVYRN